MINVATTGVEHQQMSPISLETLQTLMNTKELMNKIDNGYDFLSVGDDPDQWEKDTQVVLDYYWPGTTDLHAIKTASGKVIYTAMYNDEEVIVKSITYTAEQESADKDQMVFLNYIGEDLNVATYIEPGVVTSDDQALLVTMSRFVPGSPPEEVGDQAPYTWIYDENAVKTIGKFWHDYRQKSIDFKAAHLETYEKFPDYKTFNHGWERHIGKKITIPVTETSYGVIHGDAHTGNFMLESLPDDQWEMSMLDFDNAETAWFVIDVGTEVFCANLQMWAAQIADAEREAHIT